VDAGTDVASRDNRALCLSAAEFAGELANGPSWFAVMVGVAGAELLPCGFDVASCWEVIP
jgi:hypothetical protein